MGDLYTINDYYTAITSLFYTFSLLIHCNLSYQIFVVLFFQMDKVLIREGLVGAGLLKLRTKFSVNITYRGNFI